MWTTSGKETYNWNQCCPWDQQNMPLDINTNTTPTQQRTTTRKKEEEFSANKTTAVEKTIPSASNTPFTSIYCTNIE